MVDLGTFFYRIENIFSSGAGIGPIGTGIAYEKAVKETDRNTAKIKTHVRVKEYRTKEAAFSGATAPYIRVWDQHIDSDTFKELESSFGVNCCDARVK